MKFFRTIRYDLIRGILKRPHFLLMPIISVMLCLRCSYILNLNEVAGSWLDYVMFCFKGMKPYNSITVEEGFMVPLLWIVLLGAMLYTSLEYPFKDAGTIGQQVILRSDKRIYWWLSKCIWNLLTIFACFLLIYSSVAAFCIANGVPMIFENFYEATNVIFSEVNDSFADSVILSRTTTAVLVTIIMPIISTMAISMFQMLLGLFMKQIYSFVISMAVLIISAYSTFPLALGNYSMVIRNEHILESGMKNVVGFILSTIGILLSIAFGSAAFTSFDIFQDKKNC